MATTDTSGFPSAAASASSDTPPIWISNLRAQLSKGTPVYTRSDARFFTTTSLFSQSIVSPAKVVVCVRDATQVSTVIVFARSNNLSISVKGGGYNTAGWAVQGDIVIDLSLIDQVEVGLSDGKGGYGPSLSGSCGNTPTKKRSSADENDRPAVSLNKKAKGDEHHSPSHATSSDAKNGVDDGDMSRSASGSGSRTSDMSNGSSSRSRHSEETGETSRPSREGSAAKLSHHTSSEEDERQQHRQGLEACLADQNMATDMVSAVSAGTTNSSMQSDNGSALTLGGISATKGKESASEGTRFWVAEQSSTGHSSVASRNLNSNSTSSLGNTPNVATAPTSVNGHSHLISSSPRRSAIELSAPSSTASRLSTTVPQFYKSMPEVYQTSPVLPFLRDNNTLPLSFASSSRPAGESTDSGPYQSSRADPQEGYPLALVTIGAGAQSKQIDLATSPYGVYVPLAAYPVGCAIFASGGFGFMSRLHGLSMDNVVEVEMVLADGRIVHLQDSDSPIARGFNGTVMDEEETEETKEKKELWWAFRGAGIAFGVITKVRSRAYRVGLVYSGNMIYPFNPVTAPSLIKHWRDCCKNAPRELYMNLILTAGPNPSSHVIVIQICYFGDRAVGDQFVQSIMSWEGERSLFKDVEMRTFMTQKDSVKNVLDGQGGSNWCVRADLMDSLPDDCIYRTVNQFRGIPERSAWLFEIAGGAIADVNPDASCFPLSHRSAPFQVAAIHQWKNSENDESEESIRVAREWIDSVISPHSPGGSYPCFLEAREGLPRVRGTFGVRNWDRLVALKRKWDPKDLLRHTFWPRSSDEEVPRFGA